MKNKIFLTGIMLFTAVAMSLAQNRTVSGKVVFATDNTAATGVNVIVKGINAGTVTDVDGAYSLSVSSGNAVLVFQMIGMVTQEVSVGNQSVINVSMAEDTKLLDEIVVTGYTTERKKDITGAVSVIKMKDVESIPGGNVLTALQGRVPGVQISTDGQPGGTSTGTLVRGITSVGDGSNTTPLYVIDGVQTRDNMATLLNPNDVESIQVLKDAAAAAIYGLQAANGVIIVTTKKAAKGKTRVNFDAKTSVQTYHSPITMLDAQQWGEIYWKAYQNDGVAPAHDQYGSGDVPVIPEFIDAEQTIRAGNTDWAKEVYRPAVLQDYNLSVTNSSENASTLFSFNYFNQDGLIKNTNFERFNVRLNSDYRLWNNRFRVGENVNISKWKEVLKPGGIEELVIAQHPLIPVYDINGGYAGPTSGLGDKPNPVRLLNQQKDNYLNQWRIFGNMYAELEPVKNLVIRSSFGLNYYTGFESNFEPKWKEGTSRIVNKNTLYVSSGTNLEWTWANTAAYALNIGKHAANFLTGMEAKEATGRNLWGRRETFQSEDLNFRYLDAGTGEQTNGGGGNIYRVRSYFGKVNYAYADKYLFSATVRNDASSHFLGRSATFPGITAGWRITGEDFMQKQNIFDDLKLRASWGKNGTDGSNAYARYSQYASDLVSGGYDIYGINKGDVEYGILKTWTGNPDIRWEITTQTNLGVDFTMLKNRLSVNFDYFWKNTDDMIISRPYIGTIGQGGYMSFNGASLGIKGFESIITWRDKVGKDFSYELTFTGSHNRTIITDVPDDLKYTLWGGNGTDKSIVGQPFGSWLGYKTDGLFRTQDEVDNYVDQPGKGIGRIRYQNLYDDGVINSDDRDWLGSDQPSFIGGLNIALAYKNFDCTFYFNGLVRKAWNNSKFYTEFFQLWTGNHSTHLYDAFHPETNPNGTIPMLTSTNANDEGRSSDYFIEDGSYLKLKNFQFGYTLPSGLLQKVKISNVRVYFQAQDLFTLTRYTGPDPEALGYPYPIPRTFTLGLNVSL
ncbi:SusC/RagA family TonB-linked outer membrane protein [Bacteroidia bacterium]|nr:SusC/RagA family TonB-linked outer membrane protein [Bacteroidia bacterium]